MTEREVEMIQLRLGIIGCGNIVSRAHIPALSEFPGVKVIALADPVDERLKKVGDQLGITDLYSDYKDLVALDNLDAVVVCAPNCEHASASIAALQAGKHVLCEKPIAMTFDEAKEIAKAAGKSGKIFLPGMNNRFRSESLFIKRQIENGI
ncbi:MAG: Gfo/Idh/MocA family oxidoreductase, partial [Candidatus Eremiobacteraeota bacterium]|nr:Gfo/Idh/MocA family oxidoreductase [Candidatus Eremiobacteraeota bacterium]